LEIDGGLPVTNQNAGVFQRLEVNEFGFQVVRDVLLLLLRILGNELIDIVH
jgi:hypothetical protein